MRTTVDLPPAVRRRAQELAKSRGQSLSAVLAEMTARGLGQMEQSLVVRTDDASGFPVVSIGRPTTSEDVAAALDDE
ncbi:MAG: hypothetical protein ACRDQA_06665 [Nocardioidaceae bacterium]